MESSMKRDKQLIRQLLEFFEEHGTPYTMWHGPWDNVIDGRSAEEVEYHLELCKNLGYLLLNQSGTINMLSDYGHDALDEMRGD